MCDVQKKKKYDTRPTRTVLLHLHFVVVGIPPGLSRNNKCPYIYKLNSPIGRCLLISFFFLQKNIYLPSENNYMRSRIICISNILPYNMYTHEPKKYYYCSFYYFKKPTRYNRSDLCSRLDDR